MKFIDDVRNPITARLEDYLGIPVKLSDQTSPVPDPPFCFYSVITPYATTGEQGDYDVSNITETSQVTITRTEQPSATFSFTFASFNRWSKDASGNDCEPYINGEDESQSLAEKAQGFFLMTERDALSNKGIVVVDVTNATPRISLVVDEAARRYGFDVRIRYTRADSRIEETVGSVVTTQQEKE